MNTKEAELKYTGNVRNIIKWSARIAAILILPLLIFSGIYFYRSSVKGNNAWVEIKVPAWTRAQFSLPDGTTGWLNSSSSLRYKGDYIKDRKITLNGEAFFDVQKDTKRPFVVITSEVRVTALGTRFNIASYENEKDVEVVLEEGKLIFSNKEMNKSYTMNPNDLVVYNKSLKDFTNEAVQPQKYLSWKEGKLIFRNDPLDVIARRIERWYNVDVELQGYNLEDLRLRATFIDENLEEVLYFLKRSLSINYRIENGKVRDDGIYSKKKVIITQKNR
jgi:ferric-dicitrate binding protein FerR (iron transport regulator)